MAMVERPRHVMVKIRKDKCISEIRRCSKAVEFIADILKQYFKQNNIEDEGYTITITEQGIYIYSLTELELQQFMEITKLLLEKLKDSEFQDIIPSEYLKSCLIFGSCVYFPKNEDFIASIEPQLLITNPAYTFLWSIVKPFVRDMPVGSSGVWP